MNVWPLPRITFRQLSTVREERPTALITEPAAWSDIKSQIDLPLVIQAEPVRKDKKQLESLGDELPPHIEVIYGIGNDRVIDIAKIIASRSGRPLVVIPTAFSSDRAFSWMATAHGDGGAEDIATGPAEEVIINWSIITEADAAERGAGIVEVISIVTALLDWRLAQQKNKTTPETRLSSWAQPVAAALAHQAMKSAPEIRKGTPEALRGLLDLLCMTVQLNSVLGHQRASRGAEHIFADFVKADPSVSHAEKVAAGILFAAALHNQDPAPFRTSLSAAGVRLGLLKPPEIRAAANKIGDYVRERNLPYGILSDLPDDTDMNAVLTRSTLLDAPKVT